MDSGASNPTSLRAFTARVAIVLALVALAALLWVWRDVFLLAFGAALIAIALHGLADPIRKHTPLSNGMALAVAGIVLFAIFFGCAWLFGSQIAREMSVMIERLPGAWATLKADLSRYPLGAPIVRELEAMVGGTPGSSMLGGFLQRLGAYGVSLANAAVEMLLVIFAAIYFAAAPRTYRDGLLALLPAGPRERVGEAMDSSAIGLKRWLLSTLVSMVFVGVLMTAGLLALGVPAALAIGIVTGLSQFVPLVGPLLSAVPAILLGLTISPETALWAFVLHFTLMQTESNLVYPLIQQRAVSIPPALTLFAVVAMGLLFGALGVLLATPLALVAIIFTQKLYLRDTLHEPVKTAL